jgi:hypothetical protein
MPEKTAAESASFSNVPYDDIPTPVIKKLFFYSIELMLKF